MVVERRFSVKEHFVPEEETRFFRAGTDRCTPIKGANMTKLMTFLTSGLMSVLLFASVALAEEVKTDYFTLNLDEEWTQPQPVQSANGAVLAIVQHTSDKSVLSVAISPIALPAKDVAEQTLANMKTNGFTVSELKPFGDSYMAEFSQNQSSGVSYFTSNGKVNSVVTILGKNTDAGKEFMNKHFKAADAKLFPAKF